MSHGFMLDTVIFNRLVDNPDRLAQLRKFKLYATHVQLDELRQTSDPRRESELVAMFEQVEAESLTTSSSVWDVSNWDQGWGSSDGLFDKLHATLEEADSKTRKKHTGPNNRARDVLQT